MTIKITAKQLQSQPRSQGNTRDPGNEVGTKLEVQTCTKEVTVCAD